MTSAFTRELERLVVAQVCTSFEMVESAAVDALAELLSRFLQQLGQLSHTNMDVAGRTILNIRDVISALGDVDLCVVQVLRNVGAFEVPFAHALPPRLQLRRLPKRAPSFRELCFDIQHRIPAFLPALPDSHTFKILSATYHTATCTNFTSNTKEDSFFDLKGDFSSAHCYRDDDGISSRQRHLLRASAASNDTQEILSSPQALPLSDEIKWNRRGVINSSMVSGVLVAQHLLSDNRFAQHHLQSTGGPEVCCKMKYASGR
mmetsp:Transcript_13304/g.57905  ORF Transcript_13304/g.57905 Transcript_13304/m.57905 type:complete len:261 (-) Transcript_13304:1467-2249(-)